MSLSYFFDDKTYGRIEVSESTRSRQISLRVAPGGKMKLVCPTATSAKELALFMAQNRESIGNLVKKQAKKSPLPTAELTAGSTFRTRSHEVLIMPTSTDSKLHLKLQDSRALLTYPRSLDEQPEARREAIKHILDKLLKAEALEYLPARVHQLAQDNGLHYDHVDLRNMTSRWGSCSTGGRICLNIQLMRLPDHLIDMVILHELNHTVHMDHSKAFWADLDRLCDGKAKALTREMKSYSTKY